MSEKLSWIDESIRAGDQKTAAEIIENLISQSGINLVSECMTALEIAQQYQNSNQEIPVGLVKAIQILYDKPSGYTGLTVWEAYSYQLRSKNK